MTKTTNRSRNMKIKELTAYLETIAPPLYQESYDNAGLIVGDPAAEITGVLLCLDSTEAVVAEAVEKGCNLIVAHHPIIFRGLKQITGRSYVERVVIGAIREEIAIYAIHTNLDNVYLQGVNGRIAQKIGLHNTRILAPKGFQKKLVTSVDAGRHAALTAALTAAGGAVTAQQQLRTGKDEPAVRLEVAFAAGRRQQVIDALQNEANGSSATYELLPLENQSAEVGSGMIGELPAPMPEKEFLRHLRQRMQTNCIRHTALSGKPVQRVAVCGGAGSFLLGKAITAGADFFVTADFKYHEFFDAEDRIVIADIGHYESEQFTIELLYELISQKFTNFAAHCTEVNTNPVQYYF